MHNRLVELEGRFTIEEAVALGFQIDLTSRKTGHYIAVRDTSMGDQEKIDVYRLEQIMESSKSA